MYYVSSRLSVDNSLVSFPFVMKIDERWRQCKSQLAFAISNGLWTCKGAHFRPGSVVSIFEAELWIFISHWIRYSRSFMHVKPLIFDQPLRVLCLFAFLSLQKFVYFLFQHQKLLWMISKCYWIEPNRTMIKTTANFYLLILVLFLKKTEKKTRHLLF